MKLGRVEKKTVIHDKIRVNNPVWGGGKEEPMQPKKGKVTPESKKAKKLFVSAGGLVKGRCQPQQ